MFRISHIDSGSVEWYHTQSAVGGQAFGLDCRSKESGFESGEDSSFETWEFMFISHFLKTYIVSRWSFLIGVSHASDKCSKFAHPKEGHS